MPGPPRSRARPVRLCRPAAEPGEVEPDQVPVAEVDVGPVQRIQLVLLIRGEDLLVARLRHRVARPERAGVRFVDPGSRLAGDVDRLVRRRLPRATATTAGALPLTLSLALPLASALPLPLALPL